MSVRIFTGDCHELLRTLPDASIDSVVTDPPAGIRFMGREWDSDKGGRKAWIGWMQQVAAECLRVLKPGGHALVWAIPRTSHWTATAWENAGFEVRDRIAHIFGSGYPKSHNLSDEWKGWGTALKPAMEDWWLLRKPFRGTVAANVLAHGTGALNIDACRIGTSKAVPASASTRPRGSIHTDEWGYGRQDPTACSGHNPNIGRWPANIITDGSDEVVAAFPDAPGQQVDISTTAPSAKTNRVYGAMRGEGEASADRVYSEAGATNFALKPGARRLDEGSAARFFYTAKPSTEERNIGGVVNGHPTVKPLALMQYLVRLVTPPGGTVLDCFAGSGTTGIAADREGFDAVLIEQDPEFAELARRRISGDSPLFAEVA